MSIPFIIYFTMVATILGVTRLLVLVGWYTLRDTSKNLDKDHRWHGRSLQEFKAYIHKILPNAAIEKDCLDQIIIYTDLKSEHGTLKQFVI